MDWWRMERPFSRVRKIFFRGRIFQENPWNSAERAIFAKFQAPKFENSEPEKLQFHTPSHSIPPLDSLLINLDGTGSLGRRLPTLPQGRLPCPGSESGRGGWKTQGGRKTYRKFGEKPFPKKRFWIPHLRYVSPPFWQLSVISLERKRHRPDQPQFLRPPKVVLESTLCSTFPPPPKFTRYVLPPPSAAAQLERASALINWVGILSVLHRRIFGNRGRIFYFLGSSGDAELTRSCGPAICSAIYRKNTG